MNKILVSYFSCSGVTKDVAIKLNEILKGDLFAIVPTNFYTDADLDWNNAYSRSSIEMKDESARPKVRERVANIEEYDTVFLGYPIWWDEAPRIVNTFLEENNLVGKNIYVFATSGGSLVENSFEKLIEAYPCYHFVSAKIFNRYVSRDEVLDWIKY